MLTSGHFFGQFFFKNRYFLALQHIKNLSGARKVLTSYERKCCKKWFFSMFFDPKRCFTFRISILLVCMLKSVQNAIEICYTCLIKKFLLKRNFILKVDLFSEPTGGNLNYKIFGRSRVSWCRVSKTKIWPRSADPSATAGVFQA